MTVLRHEKKVFIFVCSDCGRRHYNQTNTLAPFIQREHKTRYFCEGKFSYSRSEQATSEVPRYVS